MAILLHALFNAIVVFFFPNGSLLMATIIGLVGSGVVTLLIYLGFREERKWLVESLDQKIVDLLKTELTIDEQEWLADFMSQQTGVSFAEVRASQFYESLNDILEPIAQQFPRKSKLLKRIVLQQAQISIKRKVLKELQDGKRRLELEQEIAQMQDNVINLRRDAGGCMMMPLEY